MRKLSRSIIILFAALLCFRVEGQELSCQIAEAALRSAEAIRGLRAVKEVPCTLEDKERVLSFLKDAVTRKIPRNKLEGEERAYKALGFIPDDYPYMEELLKLYADQVGGYYDPEKKRYVMAAWLPAAMQPAIAVHELTHALQDQSFDLEAFTDDEGRSSDELLARAALVEGDATAVMNDYQLGLNRLGTVAKLESVDSLILQTILGSYLTKGFASAPEAIRNTMIFPYTSGLRFVHHFLREGGYGQLDRLFRTPPQSTAEILHPEIYPLARADVSDESLHLKAGSRMTYRDSFGEFFISSWLASKLKSDNDAVRAAAGILNDRLVVDETGAVHWASVWRTDGDARDFEKAAREALAMTGHRYEVSRVNSRTVTIIVSAK